MIDRNFVQCYEFSKEIQSESSRVKKSSILIYNRSDCILYFLKFLLDANITTGISVAKINKKLSMKLDSEIDFDFFSVCHYISNNPSNDKTLWVAQSYVEKVRRELNGESFADFAKLVFTKRLRLGIDAKTVNKAYGFMLVPNFEVQLAKSIENVKIHHNEWFSISQKINGNRCICYRGKCIADRVSCGLG